MASSSDLFYHFSSFALQTHAHIFISSTFIDALSHPSSRHIARCQICDSRSFQGAESFETDISLQSRNCQSLRNSICKQDEKRERDRIVSSPHPSVGCNLTIFFARSRSWRDALTQERLLFRSIKSMCRRLLLSGSLLSISISQ